MRLSAHRYLTDPELRELLRVARQSGGATGASQYRARRDYMLLALLANTGIRPGEAIRLQLEDLRLTDHEPTIRVRRLKKRRTAGLIDDLPVSRGLARQLRSFARTVPPGPPLFPLTVRHVERVFRRHAAGAGIDKRTPVYALRHTCGTRLWRAQHDLRAVQLLLGHENVQTAQIYTHSEPRDLRRVIDASDSVL